MFHQNCHMNSKLFKNSATQQNIKITSTGVNWLHQRTHHSFDKMMMLLYTFKITNFISPQPSVVSSNVLNRWDIKYIKKWQHDSSLSCLRSFVLQEIFFFMFLRQKNSKTLLTYLTYKWNLSGFFSLATEHWISHDKKKEKEKFFYFFTKSSMMMPLILL